MRRMNINAVLRMVREYLNGDMNEIDFYSNATVTDYTVSPSDTLETSNTSITISYTEGGVTKMTTQAITVNPAVTTHAVSFNANGGSGTMADVSGVSGTYTLPANGFTAPAGQQFKGWAASADGAVISGTTITVTADTTLYAIWEAERNFLKNFCFRLTLLSIFYRLRMS